MTQPPTIQRDPSSTCRALTEQHSVQELEALRGRFSERRMVFVSGNFNIIHPGHLRLLNFARDCGDGLVVGLFSDDSPGVILGYEDRKTALMSLEAVAHVVKILPDGLLETVRHLKPQIIVKGKEHEPFDNPEHAVLNEYGGHLIFSAGEQRFSARDLLRREMDSVNPLGLRIDKQYLKEHQLSYLKMASRVSTFSGARVLVIGDLIIDEYIYCEPIGMSQEDPTIVVAPIESNKFVGAAGIVAKHLSGLGAQTKYFSIVGADESGRAAQDDLTALGVEPIFAFDPSRPTSRKQRFRAQGKTLLRVSHLKSHDAGQEYWGVLFGEISRCLPRADLVLFSDFNYGCLPQPFVDSICSLCRNHKVPYLADSQASSQVGDISRFVGAQLLSATEREARLGVGDFRSGLQNVANTLINRARAANLIVKLGPEGLIILSNEDNFFTSSLMALNPNPVDVAGAGDALLAAASLAKVAGASLAEAAYIGSIAAAIQVGREGNTPLKTTDLLRELSGGG